MQHRDRTRRDLPAIGACPFFPAAPGNPEKVDLTSVFCEDFFVSSRSQTHTEWGTVAHELSHVTAETGDWAYGDKPRQALAKDDPDLTVLNADSYRYFIEGFAATERR